MTDTASTKLAACPFCGGEANIVRTMLPTPINESWGVSCNNTGLCQASIDCQATEAEAIAAWNQRSTPPSQDKREALAAWEPGYRRLEEGEIILATDEVQNDDGSWKATICAGQRAPDPAYPAHRVYRRALSTAQASAREQIAAWLRASGHSDPGAFAQRAYATAFADAIERGDYLATPVEPSPVDVERVKQIIEQEVYCISDDDRCRVSLEGAGDAALAVIKTLVSRSSVAEEWDAYMIEAVSNAPEPLKQLGAWLADQLDEDKWKTAERYLNAALQSPPVEPSPVDVERVARAVAESCHVDLSVAIHEAGGITKAIAIFGMDGISDDPRFKDWRIPSCRGVMQTAHAAIAALSTKEEGLVEELATLDVFLAAYTHHPDGEVLASAIDPTDDLLTLGQLRRILAALKAQTSPETTFADELAERVRRAFSNDAAALITGELSDGRRYVVMPFDHYESELLKRQKRGAEQALRTSPETVELLSDEDLRWIAESKDVGTCRARIKAAFTHLSNTPDQGSDQHG